MKKIEKFYIYIFTFAITMDYTPYKLKSWVNENKLDKNLLSLNPRAMHYLFNKINNAYDNFVKLNGLSKNINGSYILSNYIDKIQWEFLSNNPNAIHILEKHTDKIYWDELSKNPNAIHILENNTKNDSKITNILNYNINLNDDFKLAETNDISDISDTSNNKIIKLNIEKFNNKINVLKNLNIQKSVHWCNKYSFTINKNFND